MSQKVTKVIIRIDMRTYEKVKNKLKGRAYGDDHVSKSRVEEKIGDMVDEWFGFKKQGYLE